MIISEYKINRVIKHKIYVFTHIFDYSTLYINICNIRSIIMLSLFLSLFLIFLHHITSYHITSHLIYLAAGHSPLTYLISSHINVFVSNTQRSLRTKRKYTQVMWAIRTVDWNNLEWYMETQIIRITYNERIDPM